jgi:hypothetical protein
MTIKARGLITCISYIELSQWIRRGRIHILPQRIISYKGDISKEVDLSIFASGEMLKLEDAKARILVVLNEKNIKSFEHHPFCISKNILDIPLESIKGIAPILERYRRNLSEYDLPILDWAADEEWDDWLIWQGAHEKIFAIKRLFLKIGYSSNFFERPMKDLYSLAKISFRPEMLVEDIPPGFENWISLLKARDSVLQKLRVDGFCGTTEFFTRSILEYLHQTTPGVEVQLQVNDCQVSERGWMPSDLGEAYISYIKNLTEKNSLRTNIRVESENSCFLLLVAAYLRIFDELHYGVKDWKMVSKILSFIKFYMNGKNSLFIHGADSLLFFIACSIKTEDMSDPKIISSLLKSI